MQNCHLKNTKKYSNLWGGGGKFKKYGFRLLVNFFTKKTLKKKNLKKNFLFFFFFFFFFCWGGGGGGGRGRGKRKEI